MPVSLPSFDFLENIVVIKTSDSNVQAGHHCSDFGQVGQNTRELRRTERPILCGRLYVTAFRRGFKIAAIGATQMKNVILIPLIGQPISLFRRSVLTNINFFCFLVELFRSAGKYHLHYLSRFESI
jgi:hypothetical protein